MSILLEALRKSEKSQRAHEVPTILTDDEVKTVSESLATGPLAMLLVSALFISGWFVWHQYRVPASAARPVVAGTQEPAPETPEPADGNQAAVANTQPAGVRQQPSVSSANDGSPTVTTPVTSDAKTTRVKSSKTVADKSTGKQRTPVESYKAPAKSAPKIKPVATKSKAVTPSPTRAAVKPPATKTADKRVKKPVAVAKPKPRPEIPKPITYWELPDSIRADVPEIKFSVLVYAANPSDRFVLINGQRLVEGDNAGPDLVVKEIRRDGVIFSYRLYQFLVQK